jgi:hypothetical protein
MLYLTHSSCFLYLLQGFFQSSKYLIEQSNAILRRTEQMAGYRLIRSIDEEAGGEEDDDELKTEGLASDDDYRWIGFTSVPRASDVRHVKHV